MIMQAIPVHAQRRKTLRRNLAAMNADGFSFSVMVGLGETYLPAFVLSRNMGDLTVALIATVPILLGSILQLAAPWILERVRSYRRFAVGAAVLQSASLLALVVMALTPHVPAWAVFIPATFYWASGLSIGPAWNTWAEQIVPRRIRPGFFARRSRLCHVGVLAGLVTGGLLLRSAETSSGIMSVFAVLFGVGAAGRFVSAAMLSRLSESRDELRRVISLRATSGVRTAVGLQSRVSGWIRSLRNPGPIGKFVFFLMAVQTGVHISGPYFTPFMLRTLEMTWVQYMSLLSLGFIGKMISLPWAGRFANRHGADRLLLIGSLGVVPMSGLWVINQSMPFLVVVQILSGMMWGCYELAMLLQFFRQIPSQERVRILTLYNLGNSAAMVAGSLIGAAILKSLGSNHSAYLTVFIASTVFRAAALLLLPGGRLVIVSTRSTMNGWVSRRVMERSAAVSAGHSRQPRVRVAQLEEK
jgi:MFS family permease